MEKRGGEEETRIAVRIRANNKGKQPLVQHRYLLSLSPLLPLDQHKEKKKGSFRFLSTKLTSGDLKLIVVLFCSVLFRNNACVIITDIRPDKEKKGEEAG